MQRAQGFAAHDGRFGLLCARTSALEISGANCINRGIKLVDTRNTGVHQLNGGHLASANQAAKFDCREFGKAHKMWCL